MWVAPRVPLISVADPHRKMQMRIQEKNLNADADADSDADPDVDSYSCPYRTMASQVKV